MKFFIASVFCLSNVLFALPQQPLGTDIGPGQNPINSGLPQNNLPGSLPNVQSNLLNGQNGLGLPQNGLGLPQNGLGLPGSFPHVKRNVDPNSPLGLPQLNGQNGIPQNGFPQNGFPQNGFPQNGLPQNGLQNGLPQNGILPTPSKRDVDPSEQFRQFSLPSTFSPFIFPDQQPQFFFTPSIVKRSAADLSGRTLSSGPLPRARRGLFGGDETTINFLAHSVVTIPTEYRVKRDILASSSSPAPLSLSKKQKRGIFGSEQSTASILPLATISSTTRAARR